MTSGSRQAGKPPSANLPVGERSAGISTPVSRSTSSLLPGSIRLFTSDQDGCTSALRKPPRRTNFDQPRACLPQSIWRSSPQWDQWHRGSSDPSAAMDENRPLPHHPTPRQAFTRGFKLDPAASGWPAGCSAGQDCDASGHLQPTIDQGRSSTPPTFITAGATTALSRAGSTVADILLICGNVSPKRPWAPYRRQCANHPGPVRRRRRVHQRRHADGRRGLQRIVTRYEPSEALHPGTVGSMAHHSAPGRLRPPAYRHWTSGRGPA